MISSLFRPNRLKLFFSNFVSTTLLCIKLAVYEVGAPVGKKKEERNCGSDSGDGNAVGRSANSSVSVAEMNSRKRRVPKWEAGRCNERFLLLTPSSERKNRSSGRCGAQWPTVLGSSAGGDSSGGAWASWGKAATAYEPRRSCQCAVCRLPHTRGRRGRSAGRCHHLRLLPRIVGRELSRLDFQC
jgi:hypothetical protein